ncbi:MFS transporter [Branchiibius sp. NY16-3462-2]|uniref:MFS transporter n=1 Tax=Branchiibius sp. NY16-3462-2 TaxID=1807500 RepID=UPI00079BB8B3|nr:MFS transporter [Branchiibius sp. NY16-3462-2]KYH44948.1 MFS transporter [Branchiibius sp. NY16-3462-2]
MKRSAKLGVLRHRQFRWFFASGVTNTLGSMMTPIALAFAVLEIENSAGALARVLAVEMTANIIFVLFGGVVSDRLPRRLVLQTCRIAMAVVLGTLAALMFTGHATIGWLMVLGGLAGGISAFSLPALQGIVPQLVPEGELQEANALMSFVRNGSNFLGPALGSVLVVAGGPQWAFVIDALTFVVSSLLLLPVRLPPPAAGATSFITDLRTGWGEFRSRTWLWVIVLAFSILNAIQSGAITVLGPVIAKNHDSLGIKGWGLVLSAEAVGMLLMSLVLLKVRLNRPLLSGMLGISLFSIMMFMLGLDPVTIPLMVAALVAGAGIETFGTGWNVAMMQNVPGDVLSRVVSYDMLGSFIAIPVGMLLFGWLATVASTEMVLVAAGIVYAAVALSTLLVPSVRNLRQHSAEPATEAALSLPD